MRRIRWADSEGGGHAEAADSEGGGLAVSERRQTRAGSEKVADSESRQTRKGGGLGDGGLEEAADSERRTERRRTRRAGRLGEAVDSEWRRTRRGGGLLKTSGAADQLLTVQRICSALHISPLDENFLFL